MVIQTPVSASFVGVVVFSNINYLFYFVILILSTTIQSHIILMCIHVFVFHVFVFHVFVFHVFVFHVFVFHVFVFTLFCVHTTSLL